MTILTLAVALSPNRVVLALLGLCTALSIHSQDLILGSDPRLQSSLWDQARYEKLGALPKHGNPASTGGEDRRVFPAAAWDPTALSFVTFKPYYLPNWRSQIHIQPPPANSSEQTKAELAYMRDAMQKRTAEDLKNVGEGILVGFAPFDDTTPGFEERLKALDANATIFHLGRSLGPQFSSTNLPVCDFFLKRVCIDLFTIVLNKKLEFARPRAFMLDPTIRTVAPCPGHPAYPSGHAALGATLGLLWSEIAPKHKELFHKEGWALGWYREVGGYHYPSDTMASRALSKQFVDALRAVPGFRDDLARAKSEYAAKGP